MSYFYNTTIRNYTAAFGSLISKFQLKRDGRIVDVPLHYSGQDKFRAKHDEAETTKGRVKMTLPRMAFKLTNIEIDKNRKLNKMGKCAEVRTVENTEAGELEVQLQEVPYNFLYDVRVKTKTLDELWQIVEQMLAKFDPYVDVQINGGGFDYDQVRIALESNEITDDYEGSFEQTREIEATFHFVLEGFLYKKKSTSKIIKQIDLDFSTNIEFDPDDLGTISIDENENITITDG